MLKRILRQSAAFLLIGVMVVTLAAIPFTSQLIFPQAEAFALPLVESALMLLGLMLASLTGMEFASVADMNTASHYVWDNMTPEQQESFLDEVSAAQVVSSLTGTQHSLIDVLTGGAVSDAIMDMGGFLESWWTAEKSGLQTIGESIASFPGWLSGLFDGSQASQGYYIMPESAYVSPKVQWRYDIDPSKYMPVPDIPDGYIGYLIVFYGNLTQDHTIRCIYVKDNPYVEGSKMYFPGGAIYSQKQFNMDTWHDRRAGDRYDQWANISGNDRDTNRMIYAGISVLDSEGGIPIIRGNSTVADKDRPAGELPRMYTDPAISADWNGLTKGAQVKVPSTPEELVQTSPSTLVQSPTVPDISLPEVMDELAQHIAAISDVLDHPSAEDFREVLEKMRKYMEHINKRLGEAGASTDIL